MTHGEQYWIVYVPEIGQYTQAKSMDDVAEQARDLAAVWLDIPMDDVEVGEVVTKPFSRVK
ncbi:type II toxin-antitoxin system HicB family antitoxin [Lawsonella clevelandensis]|uniref:type II toxin-antitoxin system HicB family antitoxin n=1 Tax=Lawsonella clevelandensis TaxID=1528099 RepID=UPI0037357304